MRLSGGKVPPGIRNSHSKALQQGTELRPVEEGRNEGRVGGDARKVMGGAELVM